MPLLHKNFPGIAGSRLASEIKHAVPGIKMNAIRKRIKLSEMALAADLIMAILS